MDASSRIEPSAERLSQTLHALLAPTWPMLLTATAVVVAFFAVLLSLNESRLHALLSFYPGFHRLNNNSYYLFDRTTRYLASAQDRSTVKIALVGGSTTRDALWNEAHLAAAVTAATGVPASAIDLTSSGQNLATSWSLADQALCNGVDFVIFAVNMLQLRRNPGREPLQTYGYESPNWAAVFLGDSERKRRLAGFGSLQLSEFAAASLKLIGINVLYDLTGLRHPAIRKRRDPNMRHPVLYRTLTPSQLQLRLDRVERLIVDGREEHSARSLAQIEKLADSARHCHGRLVLFDPPVNPLVRDASQRPLYARAYLEHRQQLQKLSMVHGLPLVAPNDGAPYDSEDFFDFGHMRTETATKAATAFIAEKISRLIKQDR